MPPHAVGAMHVNGQGIRHKRPVNPFHRTDHMAQWIMNSEPGFNERDRRGHIQWRPQHAQRAYEEESHAQD